MEGITGSEVTSAPLPQGKLDSPENPYAYLFEWNEYYSPGALYFLQNKGLKTRVATESFVYDDGSLKKTFSPGTIVIPVSGQPVSGNDLDILMQKIAKDFGISVYGVATGMTREGIDLGSNKIMVLEKPSVAMIVGDGANSSDAGEIWHMLDTRFNIPVTMITSRDSEQQILTDIMF